MIFEVYISNPDSEGNYKEQLLYYPNDETFVITNSQLELALNEAGSFEFDVPNCNLRYDDFYPRKTMIRVLQNSREIFYGEVREATQNFDFTKHVYVVGELAFLFDSIQPQYRYQCTPRQMFESILKVHNSQVESRKRFEIGYIGVSDKNNYIYHYTNREDTMTALRDKMCETLNGYLRVRKQDGKRYLDMVSLADYGQYCKQEIQFGENLIDYSENVSANDIATVCIPLGTRLEDNARTPNAIEGLDEYLTIAGTKADQYHKNVTDDYVVNDSAVARFGYVRVVKEWSDVTEKDNLKAKAIEWLESVQFQTMILELTAFDLSLLDANIDSFNVGDTVHAWALPYGMNTTFPVQKKTIYLNDLDNNKMVLGNTYVKSYTSQASKAIEGLINQLPEISQILASAKDNALAMLLAETTGGHIVYEYDESNTYMTAINVCNARTIEQSTQRWVWNIHGFGFMHRNSIDDDWSELEAAITMDGQIVANFITAGALKLAGSVKNSSVAGAHLEIYDGNSLIGSWGSEGIDVSKGVIKGKFTDKAGTYSASGTRINLADGSVKSVHFAIDPDGAAHYDGTVEASKISAGTISGLRLESKTNGAKNYIDLTSDGGNFQFGNIGTTNSTGRLYATRMECSESFEVNSKMSVDKDGKVYCKGIYVNNVDLVKYFTDMISSIQRG